MLADQWDGGTLARHDKWQGPPQNLADDNDDLPFAGLLLGEPAIDTLSFLVLRFLAAAGVMRARVGLSTVKLLERGGNLIPATLEAIQRAIEEAGVKPVFREDGKPTGISAEASAS
jgi:hypothetical protein